MSILFIAELFAGFATITSFIDFVLAPSYRSAAMTLLGTSVLIVIFS